jgi:hypothetical protein
MSSHNLTADDGYQSLLGKISEVYTTGQTRATQAVNTHITETYWQIGRDIVEFEQGGKTRADYGTGLLASLSLDILLSATARVSVAAMWFAFASFTSPTQKVRRCRTN